MNVDSRLVTVFAAVVCLLLVGSLGLPAYVSPYEGVTPTYGVAHESTETFDETVDRADLEADRATAVDSLSPETQRVFAEATEAEADSGWQRVDIDVCIDELVVCDSYAERPDFPSHGFDSANSKSPSYGVVEDDGERYVTSTQNLGTMWDFGPFFEFVAKLAGLLPFTLYLAYTTYRRHRDQPRRVLGVAAYGLVLVALGLAWPYLAMVTDASLPPALVVPLAWGGIVVAVAWNRYADGGPSRDAAS
ncbi:hypothetical protein [Natrarchaeobaculum aegyptiacum]|uniref:Uncharacterized protein n=1 Tax=Natrarchaeobaculum aegyptiacum TaxID=745377 RepID=A0A2Z2HYP9_9EURY|nr:hypothetical protein [Natrarchaeobaculum aegyptiacum]ARS88688.1 hypothetical protein B1756_02235 [Natrarchaeobaculum aegyptiacum]